MVYQHQAQCTSIHTEQWPLYSIAHLIPIRERFLDAWLPDTSENRSPACAVPNHNAISFEAEVELGRYTQWNLPQRGTGIGETFSIDEVDAFSLPSSNGRTDDLENQCLEFVTVFAMTVPSSYTIT